MEKREKDWVRGTRVVLTEPAQPSQPAAVPVPVPAPVDGRGTQKRS